MDIVGWQPIPDIWTDHPTHAHNRLLSSIVLNNEERAEVADAHCTQLATAKSPTAVLLPLLGLGEWDREGADLHDKEGLAHFMEALQNGLPENVEKHVHECHINDAAFAGKAFEIFDAWCALGVVKS